MDDISLKPPATHNKTFSSFNKLGIAPFFCTNHQQIQMPIHGWGAVESSRCFTCVILSAFIRDRRSPEQRELIPETEERSAPLSVISLPFPPTPPPVIYMHSTYQPDYRQVKTPNPICGSSFRVCVVLSVKAYQSVWGIAPAQLPFQHKTEDGDVNHTDVWAHKINTWPPE